MVTSRELTHFRHFTSFSDAFCSELGDGEMVHRRDIEPAFLTVAAEVYRVVSMRAQTASTATSPRPASGGASVSKSAAVVRLIIRVRVMRYFLTRFFMIPTTLIMKRVGESMHECCQTVLPERPRGSMQSAKTE